MTSTLTAPAHPFTLDVTHSDPRRSTLNRPRHSTPRHVTPRHHPWIVVVAVAGPGAQPDQGDELFGRREGAVMATHRRQVGLDVGADEDARAARRCTYPPRRASAT